MEIYHTLNRGVDKRTIFLDDQDRFRFIHDLFEFNDREPSGKDSQRIFAKNMSNMSDFASRTNEHKKRKLLVDILTFCLMDNHYHLLLAPRIKDGVVKFMRKLNIGYAKYFNEKYKRSGALFEGRYKSVLVEDDAHFIHLPYYIHLNPLDMFAPEWREHKIKNYEKSLQSLKNYKWSSFLDYIGEKNFPSVTSRNFLLEFFGGPAGYLRETANWLKNLSLEKIAPMLLE